MKVYGKIVLLLICINVVPLSGAVTTYWPPLSSELNPVTERTVVTVRLPMGKSLDEFAKVLILTNKPVQSVNMENREWTVARGPGRSTNTCYEDEVRARDRKYFAVCMIRNPHVEELGVWNAISVELETQGEVESVRIINAESDRLLNYGDPLFWLKWNALFIFLCGLFVLGWWTQRAR